MVDTFGGVRGCSDDVEEVFASRSLSDRSIGGDMGGASTERGCT